jgi:hypothetical protein
VNLLDQGFGRDLAQAGGDLVTLPRPGQGAELVLKAHEVAGFLGFGGADALAVVGGAHALEGRAAGLGDLPFHPVRKLAEGGGAFFVETGFVVRRGVGLGPAGFRGFHKCPDGVQVGGEGGFGLAEDRYEEMTDLRAELGVFCKMKLPNVTGVQCDRWVRDTIKSKHWSDAEFCVDFYNWNSEAQSLADCLSRRGIELP